MKDATTMQTIDTILNLRNIKPATTISIPATMIAAVVWFKIYKGISMVTISKFNIRAYSQSGVLQ